MQLEENLADVWSKLLRRATLFCMLSDIVVIIIFT
jgi:hypothetical protein